MSDSDHREEWRSAKRWTWRFLGLGIGIWLTLFALAATASIALWAFGVFTADIKGRGELEKTKQSAPNRIAKQEMFEQLKADYEGYLVQIRVAKRAVVSANNPTDRELRQTELLGLRQVCISTAQQYNAEGRKVTAREFRAADLPPTLDAAACEP